MHQLIVVSVIKLVDKIIVEHCIKKDTKFINIYKNSKINNFWSDLIQHSPVVSCSKLFFCRKDNLWCEYKILSTIVTFIDVSVVNVTFLESWCTYLVYIW